MRQDKAIKNELQKNMESKYSLAEDWGHNLWTDILSMDRGLGRESKRSALPLGHQYWLVVEWVQRLKTCAYTPEWVYMRNKSADIN